jgi:FAD/FMN-containing dehydrogenase
MTMQHYANTRLLDKNTVGALRESFGGELISPDHHDYDDARKVWNGIIDRRPALVARCTGVADVRSAVRFAREHDLLVAVRGGGHNVAGTAVCDGGMVIDLSPMKGMRVDPRRCTVQAQPGLLWGELDRETQSFGFACPGGIVTHTGIAGLTLGGGFGWLQRKYGLTCDNLLSADVVAANGQFLTVSDEEHPDLFWGIRGGGGNFGIVTSFEYQLHPFGPQVLAGVLVHPAERAVEVLRFYRDYISGVPDELTVFVAMRKAPPDSWLPEDIHGRPVVILAICYAGSSLEEGERVLRPLRAFGPPSVDFVRRIAYTTHQGFFDAGVPHGLHYYWKSHYMPSLSDDAIEAIVDHAWEMRSPNSYSLLFQLGGAINRVREEDSAFSGRAARHAITIDGVWSDPDGPDDAAWVRDYFGSLQRFSTGGVYVNFLGNEGQDRVKASYGAEKYDRLVALKNKYDPTNFFRVNQNIKPTQ